MAEIKIYRSETQRVMPQGQPLSLKAPDQGIVGRAVSQLGEVVFDIGEERAKMAASTKAATAHGSYRNDMLVVERAARRMKPEDAEAYYLQHSKMAYDKASNSLTSSYAKSLFAAPAGQTAYTSRSKFYTENDARLVSAAVAGSNDEAQNHSRRAADIGALVQDRAASMRGMLSEITAQVDSGWITDQEGAARRHALAKDTLKNIMMRRMHDADSPMDVVNGLLDSDDPIVRYLIENEVTGTELDKFVREQRATADKMETKRRQQATAAAKEHKAADDADVRRVMNVTAGDADTPANVMDMVALHKDLLSRNVYTYAERQNAEKMLALMGVPEYQDDAAGLSPDSWRDPGDGDEFAATVALSNADVANELTYKMIVDFAAQGKLTRAGFASWRTALASEKSEALTTNVQIYSNKFKYERYQNSDGMDKWLTQSAYQSASANLREWYQDNPKATAAAINGQALQILDAEYDKFSVSLQEQFSSDMNSLTWRRVLAQPTVKPRPDVIEGERGVVIAAPPADLTADGLLKTARKFYAKVFTADDKNEMASALGVIKMLEMYKMFRVVE